MGVLAFGLFEKVLVVFGLIVNRAVVDVVMGCGVGGAVCRVVGRSFVKSEIVQPQNFVFHGKTDYIDDAKQPSAEDHKHD